MANEKRLIDANTLMTFVSGYVDEPDYQHTGEDWRNGAWAVDYEISIAPTVDAVEVVRCKDCKWYKEGKYLAPNKFCYRLKDRDGEHIGYNFSDDDFCSYGERKDNERKAD